MKHHHSSRGVVLPMVLFITAIGLLFGAGALLLFRYQCQLRVDRQHELEKVYAVRSALNFVRLSDSNQIPDEGKWFGYHTGSDRSLGLLVKPVSPIFPNTNSDEVVHFVMENGHFGKRRTVCDQFPCQCSSHYDDYYDYEYGGTTNLLMNNVNNKGNLGLAFRNLAATNGVRWWVNVGMRKTGGWLQEDYGRRYFFYPMNYVGGTELKDILRFALIRNVTNSMNSAGSQHGWPLTKANEQALVFEIRPMYGDSSKTNNAEMTLSEYRHTGVSIMTNILHRWYGCPALQYTGLQLAGNMASLFYIKPDKSGGYSFLDGDEKTAEFDCCKLERIAEYFANEQWIAGIRYSGTNTVDGKLEAPEMRAVFEVEAASNTRPRVQADSDESDKQELDFVSYFKVTPAYQYEFWLRHPSSATNLATVAQKIYKTGKNARDVTYTMLTYDTHGTDHKGFRYDEKQARENQ